MTTKNIIIALAGAFILFIAYQNLVAIPQQRMEAAAAQDRQERLDVENKERQNALMYDACMSDSFSAYNKRWEATCSDLGRKENCLLPSITANSYEEDRKDAENRCLALYK